MIDNPSFAPAFESSLRKLLSQSGTGQPAKALSQIEASTLPFESKAHYAFLYLKERYATAKQIEQLKHLHFIHPQESIAQLIERIWPGDPLVPEFKFVSVPNDKLYIDVTHTRYYPFNSGIQRVVRELCRSLLRLNKNYQLFYFHYDLRIPFLLTDEEAAAFLVGPPKPLKTESEKKGLKTSLKNYFRRARGALQARTRRSMAARVLLQCMQGFKSTYNILTGAAAKGAKEPRPISIIPDSPLFWDHLILTPEILGQDSLIEFYETLKQNTQISMTAIQYDLIPLYHPEYCAIGGPFLNSLKVLRFVDRVSCISNDVRQLLANFSNGVNRTVNSPIQITSHLLAGDIGKSEYIKTTAVSSSLPLVLSVATLEPRKNQIRLLRAVDHLMEQGHKFRFVLAGNPGWFNEELLLTIAEIRARRPDIDVISPVPEAQLHQLYQQARFTAFCSVAEGFGLPILESLNFGKPCITSNLGSMKEVAIEGGCLLVDPYSIESIATGIKTLLTDEARYQQLIRELQTRTKRTWNDYATEIYDFAFTTARN